MSLQIAADAVEVGLQALQAGELVVMARQNAVQVKVQDVGVEAADIQEVLEEVRGQRSGGLSPDQLPRTLLSNILTTKFVLLQVMRTLLLDITIPQECSETNVLKVYITIRKLHIFLQELSLKL